jgi:hypothetical protein
MSRMDARNRNLMSLGKGYITTHSISTTPIFMDSQNRYQGTNHGTHKPNSDGLMSRKGLQCENDATFLLRGPAEIKALGQRLSTSSYLR